MPRSPPYGFCAAQEIFCALEHAAAELGSPFMGDVSSVLTMLLTSPLPRSTMIAPHTSTRQSSQVRALVVHRRTSTAAVNRFPWRTLGKWLMMGCMAQQFQDLELTPKMADAIMPFVEDPSREWYGGELMRRTGQASGYLYPTLAKFQKNGWLTSGRENIDPREAGRPPRRYYKITDRGLAAARAQLALLSQRYAPPATVRPRVASNAGAL